MSLLDSLKGALTGPKSGGEVLLKLISSLKVLEQEKDSKAVEKSIENIAKYLPLLVVFLRGDDEHPVTKESVLELAKEINKTELIYLLIRHLALLNFENRKDVASTCSVFVRIKDEQDKSPGASYIQSRPYVLEKLFYG